MSVVTVLAYLVGSRAAILRIATTPGATWLGLVFVLSAGFAREYDGEDLLAQPWHVLLPLGVSLVLSSALFCLIMPIARSQGACQGTFWGNYHIFLRLFWMTAPIAWIYAIPVQDLFSAEGATSANLWMLAVVSLWRVVLMARVVSVLFNANLFAAFMPVLLFADTLALVALWFAPLPVFAIMGGIRLTDSERVIQGTAFTVGFFGTITWLIWLVGTCVVWGLRKKKWQQQVSPGEPSSTVSGGLWAVAACSVMTWVVILPYTQPKQQLRRRVEVTLRSGQVRDAISLMAEYEPSDFPSHWDPPPRVGYGERTPPLIDVLEAVSRDTTPSWITAIYVDKLTRQSYHYGPLSVLHYLDGDELDRYLSVLEKLPEVQAVVLDNPFAFERILEREDCSPLQHERVRAILAAAGREVEGREVEGREVEGSEVAGREVEGREVEGSEVEGSEVEGSRVTP